MREQSRYIYITVDLLFGNQLDDIWQISQISSQDSYNPYDANRFNRFHITLLTLRYGVVDLHLFIFYKVFDYYQQIHFAGKLIH